MDQKIKEIEMFIAGLVMDPNTNAPIVILKADESDSCLPIWIGVTEANAISAALRKVPMPRPMTHDLLKILTDELNAKISRIVISGLQENTFYASIEVVQGEVVRTVDSRPSDALALAVRVNAPIYVDEKVLEQAQVALVPMNEEEPESAELPPVEQLGESEFKAENLANIEKDKWSEILEDMGPDDFKYKM